MIAPTPPMGWNSWNTFGENISEELVRQTADAFVEAGLQAAGYSYVVIDDHWELRERDQDGRLVPDPRKFPNGIKPVADYVHAKGLKFGIYSCAGTLTCGTKAGSFGYEELDAKTFAEWGVDFLKYDYCYKPLGVVGKELYFKMGQALRQSGRAILFSACNWGVDEVWKWARRAGCHMWRTTGDIEDSWESMERIGFQQKGKEDYAGPNGWNDPDMLVVGMYGKGNVARGGMKDQEYRFHFALWCMLCSPLMIGCDVRMMNDETRAILTHPRLIAISQDPLGVQAWSLGEDNHTEVWKKPLADGSVAVAFFNKHPEHTRRMAVAWEALGLHDRRPCRVLDVWSGEDLGEHTRWFGMQVPPHSAGVYRLTPQC